MKNKPNTLTITITGDPGTGKTGLATLIAEHLLLLGLSVTVNENTKDDIFAAAESLRNRGTKVRIESFQCELPK